MNKWYCTQSSVSAIKGIWEAMVRDKTGVDWGYIWISLEYQLKNVGVYFNEKSLRILENNSNKIRTMFCKNQSRGSMGWTWHWYLYFPLQKCPPSFSVYGVSFGLLSLYSSGGLMIQLGQWEHFSPLDHSDWFRKRHSIQARSMRLSPKTLGGSVRKDTSPFPPSHWYY